MNTLEVWKVVATENAEGWSDESRVYRVVAHSAAQAESFGLLVARQDRETRGISAGEKVFRKPICSSASFECYVYCKEDSGVAGK